MSNPTTDKPRNTGRSQTTAVANYAGSTYERIQAHQRARQYIGDVYNYDGNNNNIIQHNGNVHIINNGIINNYYGVGVANSYRDVPPSTTIDLPRPRATNSHHNVPPSTAIDLSRPRVAKYHHDVPPSTAVDFSRTHQNTRSSPPPRLIANYQEAYIFLPSKLCAEYKVKPAVFFTKGRVFKILVPIYKSCHNDNDPEPEFAMVQQAVVILEGEDSCYALLIRTYGGQGVAKQGVKKSEHTIAYDGRRAPPTPHAGEIPGRGEAGMLPIAIRVDVDHADCQLDQRSRVDFGHKINVGRSDRVKSFGIVNRDSLPALQYYFSMVSGGLTAGGTDLSRGDKHMIADQKRTVEEEGVNDDDDEDEDEDEDGEQSDSE